MHITEFKAWFDGFTEDMDGTPTEKQWKRIKARVKEIDGVPLTQTVYVDRYRDWFRDYSRPYVTWGGGGNSLSGLTVYGASGDNSDKDFTSVSAMYALGRDEALAT